MSQANCHSELVSESSVYYTKLTYESLNISIRTKTQLLIFKNKQKDNRTCVVDERLFNRKN